jgi:hypothetical protein
MCQLVKGRGERQLEGIIAARHVAKATSTYGGGNREGFIRGALRG